MNLDDYKPVFNEQKATEAASVLLKLNGGSMNYMKLIKLLYFIDRKALREKERPITYDTYYSMKDGQVLSNILDLVREKQQGDYWHKYIGLIDRYTVKLADDPLVLQLLSPSEVDIIESIFTELGKYSQFFLGRKTKSCSEYKKTNSSIKTEIEEILADIGFGKEDAEEIEVALREKAYISSLFEV